MSNEKLDRLMNQLDLAWSATFSADADPLVRLVNARNAIAELMEQYSLVYLSGVAALSESALVLLAQSNPLVTPLAPFDTKIKATKYNAEEQFAERMIEEILGDQSGEEVEAESAPIAHVFYALDHLRSATGDLERAEAFAKAFDELKPFDIRKEPIILINEVPRMDDDERHAAAVMIRNYDGLSIASRTFKLQLETLRGIVADVDGEVHQYMVEYNELFYPAWLIRLGGILNKSKPLELDLPALETPDHWN